MNSLTSPKMIIRSLVIAAIIAAASNWSMIYSQSADQLVEEFSFLIKDFKIDHQGENNILNISISFRYADKIVKSQYPDFRWLAKDVETLLTDYPNEDDYWEIVNKEITALLLKKYPAITTITCELKVDPSRLVSYTRSSRVTRERPPVRSNRKRL